MRAHLSLPVLSISALLISILSPVSLAATPALVTCVNLQTGTERISHTGSCRYTQEAQANWRKNQSDSPIASGASAKVITICSNKESSPVSYQVIRSKCAKHQVTTVFSRSGALPNKPVIAEAVSLGYDSASLKLATDPGTNADAPIAFYTITSTTVDTRTPILTQSQKIYYWKDLSIAISALQASTRYTFTVSATTADGASPVSIASIPVITLAYVPPASTTSSGPVAAPAFTLSSTTETKMVNSAITGYTISSTGGTIASYAISPAAPAGITFNTSSGLLSGTPTSVRSATAYTITGTNASGSATATFTLTVSSSAPSFTLSSTSETRFKGFTLAGYTIDASAGAAITSYSLLGTLPAGLSFSTSTGRISGMPTETKTATNYTVIGESASGETATATYQLRITGDIGDTGPGGGKIFYYLAAGFNCGASFTDTGSPTGGKCKYLEVAPVTWITPSDSRTVLLGTRNDAAQISGVRLDATVVFDANDVGLGYKNSIAFRADSRAIANTGIRYVRDYNGGSLSDWYLPTSTELNILVYWSKGLTPIVSTRSTSSDAVINGNFDISYYYYSSSQTAANPYSAYIQNFSNGTITTNQWSDSGMRVRPIRAF
jgi:hypothetical protein